MNHWKTVVNILWIALLGLNLVFMVIWMPSDPYIPLKSGQYRIDSNATDPDKKVMIRSDLFSPIALSTAGFINFALATALITTSYFAARKINRLPQ